MLKKLLALSLALSLAIMPAPQAHAETLSEEEVGAILFGLVAAFAITKVIDSVQDDDDGRKARRPDRTTRSHDPFRNGVDRIFGRDRRDRDDDDRADRHRLQDIPLVCLERVEFSRNDRRVFTRSCLRAEGVRTNRLPRECRVRLFDGHRQVRGFDPACLRDAGYRARRD